MRLRAAWAGALVLATSSVARAEPDPAPAGALAPTAPAGPSAAPEPSAGVHRLRFDAGYRAAGPIEGIATAALLGTWLVLQLGVPLAEEPRWTDVPGFERSARDGLVASSRTGRNTAAVWSDVLWLAPMVWAGADSVVVPLATDRFNTDVTLQLTILSGEAFAVAGLAARGGHLAFARDRPDTAACRADGDYSHTCGAGRTASFPSGHAAGAFAGAGLVCAHHAELPLYGHPWPDVGACVLATTFATTSSVLRLVGDRHYVGDVLAGGAVGFAAGLGLPMLLHYHAPWVDEPEGPVRARLVPSAPGAEGGASVAGAF